MKKITCQFTQWLICNGLFFVLVPAAWALDSLNLQMNSLQAVGMEITQPQFQLELRADNSLSVKLKAAKLKIPALQALLQGTGSTTLKQLELHCAQLIDTANKLTCVKGRLTLAQLPVYRNSLLRFEYHKPSAALKLWLTGIKLGGGRVNLHVNWQGPGKRWKLNIQLKNFSHQRLSGWWLRLWQKWLPKLPAGFELTLPLNAELDLQGKTTLEKISGTISSRGKQKGLTLNNAQGTIATENLKFELALNLRQVKQDWAISTRLKLYSGAVYAEPAFIEVQKAPIVIQTELDWSARKSRLHVRKLHYLHKDILEWQARGFYFPGKASAFKKLHLELFPSSLKNLQKYYLQAWLETAQSNLRLRGLISARLDWDKASSATLTLSRVSLSTATTSIRSINGSLHWLSEKPPNNAPIKPSQISWSGLQLGTLSLPAAYCKLEILGDKLRLLQPWKSRLLDGSVTLNTLEISGLGGKPANYSAKLSANFKPISMSALSHTLGFPELGGELAAVIPAIHYQKQQLRIEGALLLKVFDGDVIIHNLSLQNPFGETPQLRGKVDFKQLDLELLTRFFEFGEISGRLDGYIRKLHLYNWQPVAFDAWFGTPEKDRSPHKISQKALNNLSSLGGASVTDALSRSILRVFSAFSYARIGWGCVLKNNTCQMSGVEPAKQGYYIVKGGGLPRIDVIGFNHRVNWQTLLQRLKSATNIGAPVIE
ncbi:hypothetical protein QUF61_04840 [Candidatus Venteria ishoeyi]|uniref:hypothetical protein n=1 Tax=Candidatus Venteria ishoeyi TaxID=1899563 RepID=UPI0025A610D1|nr:hypothetical protein [Candidatus Venteria ishoeyi]MDM8545796.1 hypothetical protein [Candidatus Venteria ishoeyi]